MITIINIKNGIPNYTAAIYIGRQMPGRAGSPLGNPYRIHRESERADCLERYRNWLEGQMLTDTPARREIYRIAKMAEMGSLLLLCWCAPKQCHGDVVKEIVEGVITSS